MSTSTATKSFWKREFEHYPNSGQRLAMLVLAIIATIALYYQSALLGAVFPLMITSLGISLQAFTYVVIVLVVLGALASLFGNFADRFGRVRFVIGGLLFASLITLATSFAPNAVTFYILYCLLGFVEGVILVASPALVRDFSPRVGRATALGFWTIGGTGGNVIAPFVFSLTFPLFHTWQSQFVIAAIVGLIVTALCFFFLRDLSPQLRAQVIDTARESEAIDAHAKDVDVDAAMRNPWRQVLRPRIVFSVIGFSVSLIIYFAAQNYFPTYLNLVLKFPLAEADGLVSFFFFMSIAFAILAGIASDLTLVRKPFLLAGAIIAIVGVVLFIAQMGQTPNVLLMGAVLLLITAGISIYNVPWLAAYTETIEDINPGLVGTGMALYGFFIRVVVIAATFGFSFVVATNGNWLAWWWVSIAGLVVFLPVSLTVAGYWTRGKALAAIRAHEEAEGLTVPSGSAY